MSFNNLFTSTSSVHVSSSISQHGSGSMATSNGPSLRTKSSLVEMEMGSNVNGTAEVIFDRTGHHRNIKIEETAGREPAGLNTTRKVVNGPMVMVPTRNHTSGLKMDNGPMVMAPTGSHTSGLGNGPMIMTPEFIGCHTSGLGDREFNPTTKINMKLNKLIKMVGVTLTGAENFEIWRSSMKNISQWAGWPNSFFGYKNEEDIIRINYGINETERSEAYLTIWSLVDINLQYLMEGVQFGRVEQAWHMICEKFDNVTIMTTFLKENYFMSLSMQTTGLYPSTSLRAK